MPFVEISTGELIDKITILEIKLEKMQAAEQRKNVGLELQVLLAALEGEADMPSGVVDLMAQLKQVNSRLWEIEDEIRDCERNGDFHERFIDLARSVYRTNDQRAELKREINRLSGSRLIEEKSYSAY